MVNYFTLYLLIILCGFVVAIICAVLVGGASDIVERDKAADLLRHELKDDTICTNPACGRYKGIFDECPHCCDHVAGV